MIRSVLFATAIGCTTILGGCAISQRVNPARISESNICVVEAPKVKTEFREALITALNNKGLSTRVVQADSASECDRKITYMAHWSWDLALYLSRADITVFEGGVIVGKATYNSTMGGARPDKFISADKKVRELVEQLFPGGPSAWAPAASTAPGL